MSRIAWIVALVMAAAPLSAQVRLKDIAGVEGVRNNALTGFGIVVGLNGTGDKDQTRFTTQALANALSKSGISLDPTAIKVKNVAFALVQAELPPFSRSGTLIDVRVSSAGDATSLQGGSLLLTELKAVNGETYALAQGALSIGGFAAGGSGSQTIKNHPTVGYIPNGAIVERATPFDSFTDNRVRFWLRESDFTTMSRAVEAINSRLGSEYARPVNGRTLEVMAPPEMRHDMVSFVSLVENVALLPDAPAKIVINERTGTIIIGENAKIRRVAIAHGNLTIQIQTENLAVPSGSLVEGPAPVIQTNTDTFVTEDRPESSVLVAQEGVTLGEIAETLNALKVTPRDIIAIFQALKEAGAIHAELKLI